MPRDPGPTRQAIADAALRLFADRGVAGATIADITAAAGQRNSSAVQYHFGSRQQLLGAALAPLTRRVRDRRAALVEVAAGGGDVRAAADAFVAPLAELLTGDWQGRAFLRIIADLAADPSRTPAEISALVGETGAAAANALLVARSGLERALARARLGVAETMVIYALAAQARLLDSGTRARARRPDPALFAANLTDMYLAALTAPPSAEVVTLLGPPPETGPSGVG
ncbi:MAG TPA: TetR family transcriptional regulator [Mycobacteriales bacterium]|nr:TetR family transcriptional regulator [Mycobacteriales bacterium]